MRMTLVTALALLGAMALTAGAVTPAVPAICLDACEVPSHSFYYLPPVLTVQDGVTVTWTSLDTVHVHVETPVTTSDQGTCFHDTSNVNGEEATVRFDIEDGQLLATTDPGTPQAETQVCQNAVGLEDGGFALAYHCTLHSQMRGALVVVPQIA